VLVAGATLLGLVRAALVAGDVAWAVAAAERANVREGVGDPSVEREIADLLRSAAGGIRLEAKTAPRATSERVRMLVADLEALVKKSRPA
jgi:hypothetical protein